MVDLATEWEFREGAFAHLRAVQLRTGGPVKQTDVADYRFRGQSFRLMPPQSGIWKPRQLGAALSFVSVAAREGMRPYEDHEGPDGLVRYKWRGTDPEHADNRALRAAMGHRLPLIYFKGIAKGLYEPIYPVDLVGEEPSSMQFVVALDEVSVDHWGQRDVIDLATMRRYAERVTRQRVHQPVFRSMVLRAYGSACALCNLRHTELLDAAHIRPDSRGGEPVVRNGISMCKIHHAAYDTRIIGIRPDRAVEVRPDVLEEEDGPTLRYSLQGLHGSRMRVPRSASSKPDPELLEERWEEFRASA